jgi:NADPH-dependent 2,4-dienoyl-CoA reductase/sulfur reductase-like enzyme/ferredoxin
MHDSESQPKVAATVLQLHEDARADRVEVTFRAGPTVLVKVGEALLDIAEANQVPLESGCRMGMCGSDPVRILTGEDNLSPMRRAERATLERLGLTQGCRMACVARVHGPVTLIHSVEDGTAEDSSGAAETAVGTHGSTAEQVQRVVVIGAGVAGVTSVEELRKRRPDVEITLLGAEPHEFYNRMAISKLLSESTAINALYLRAPDWATRHRVRYLSGVAATAIDRQRHTVMTDEGDCIPYDRLILATGAQPWVPPIPGFGLGGSFVLRTIDDAVQIQQHIGRRRCRRAVVVGGGLLGLEIAAHLSELGVRVRVLDRGPWLLHRQLDQEAGLLLGQMIQDLGIDVLTNAELRRIRGEEWIDGVELVDGREFEAEVCVVATGIQPDIELARAAGLGIGRGVVVDDRMMTSDPHIFGAGDVVDHDGQIYGLWPSCIETARVAVKNLLGEDEKYRAVSPPAHLKVPGIDLLSIGQVEAHHAGETEVQLHDESSRRYRKLILREGTVVGALLLGYPELAEVVTSAVEAGVEANGLLPGLEQGDWSVLSVGDGATRSEWCGYGTAHPMTESSEVRPDSTIRWTRTEGAAA